jgi:tetratricopeptide (TPR) repeat protein
MDFKTKKFSRRDILFGLGRNFRQQDAAGARTGFGWQAKEIDAQMRAGDYQAAAETLERVLHKSPDHLQARKNFGFCLLKTQRFAEAEKQFQMVLQDKQNDPFALLYLGLALVKQDRVAEAVSWWKGYFNPDQPIINRVLNMQTSLSDMGALGSKEEIEKSVEIAIREQQASDAL